MKPIFTCQFASHTYPVFLDEGLLDNPLLSKLLHPRLLIITDDTVKDLYGEKLQQQLKEMGKEVELIFFLSGDEHKTRKTKEHLEDVMQELGLNRDFQILALGGGVVLDLAGYIAATYCRGVSFISIPTTLLAMVDACLGGKTGVNTLYGKNRIGAIYHPVAIIIDPKVLETLSREKMQEGMVEMAKHLILFDEEGFFNFFENYDAILHQDPEILKNEIHKSLLFKKRVVESDERETSFRSVLNFGHTFGHALEALSEYKISHGHAVCLGMLMESYLSYKKGVLPLKSYEQISKMLSIFSFFNQYVYEADRVYEVMKLDKKSHQQQVMCVSIAEVGKYSETLLTLEVNDVTDSLEILYAYNASVWE